ncbi:hypothetical protein EJ06DRAFT_451728, partial [Trichodelitschia bisporula]
RTQAESLQCIQEALNAHATRGDSILLGDFNTHHRRWGGTHTAPSRHARDLLQVIDTAQLVLASPIGIPTWRRGASATTLDLTLMT